MGDFNDIPAFKDFPREVNLIGCNDTNYFRKSHFYIHSFGLVDEWPESETQDKPVWVGCGPLLVMSKCSFPLLNLSNGTSEDRNQSDETDADIRWRIHLQLVSPELPLTAGALRYAAMLLQDSSISSAS